MKGRIDRRRGDHGRGLIEEMLGEADRMAMSASMKARLRYGLMLHGANATRKDRRRADRVVAEVQREMLAGMEETMRMEVARGGEVVDFNDAGAKRLTSRDGLLSLYEAKRLSAEQVAVGLAYRAAREAGGLVRSALGGDGTGCGGVVDHVGLGLVRAKLSVASSRVDRAVALELRHRPEALEVLRRVAGDGWCLRSMASGGKGFERLLEALTMALEVAARRVVAGQG